MKNLLPKEFKEKLTDPAYLILDVRENWEYTEERICDCVNIPLHDLPFRLTELTDHKDKTILVYCRSGKRGSQAKKFLTLNGFKEVYNLEGGIEAYHSVYSLTL